MFAKFTFGELHKLTAIMEHLFASVTSFFAELSVARFSLLELFCGARE